MMEITIATMGRLMKNLDMSCFIDGVGSAAKMLPRYNL